MLDEGDNVAAWVKNDHLSFQVLNVDRGVVQKYRPDFLLPLKKGKAAQSRRMMDPGRLRTRWNWPVGFCSGAGSGGDRGCSDAL